MKTKVTLFLLLLLYNDWRHPWAAELSDLQIRFPQDGEVRDKRQIQTGFNRKVPDLSDIQQGCEIQGYETREREICEEIVERICLPIKVAKYRKEIITRCDTRLRQECNTTLVEVPKEVCQDRPHKECFQDFDLVPDTRFITECESIVQHVCEEHYNVAVPKPVVYPVPIFAPTPAAAVAVP